MREFVDKKSLSRPAFLSQKKIKTEEDYNFEAMQKMITRESAKDS